MLSDAETASNGRGDNETPKSNGTSSPWSLLSNRKINSSDDDESQEPSPEPVEPIAIIGMSCRLSGSATDTSSLWDLLKSGRTAWTPGPGRRFNMKAFQDQTGIKNGTVSSLKPLLAVRGEMADSMHRGSGRQIPGEVTSSERTLLRLMPASLEFIRSKPT